MKSEEIKLFDLSKIENSIFQYFIVCEGTSSTHTKAIAESIQRKVKKEMKRFPTCTEGENVGDWILLDYNHTLVHVFLPETRQRYNLEDLWGDAIIQKITN